jgi:ketosteroid isomerase-like protein
MLTKTLPFVALLASTAVAAPPPKSPAAQRDPRLAALDQMKTAIEARDARAFAALYADDAVIEESGGSPVRGRAQIEASAREMMAPAKALHWGIARAWLTDDVIVVESVFRAHHGIESPLYDVGDSELSIFWFDASGHIAKEHSYRDQPTIEAQAAGDPEAPEIPMLPDEPEIHISHGGTDAATIGWVRDVETKWDTVDADPATHSDDLVFECVSGHFHGTSRAETVAAMKHWRTAFPRQTNRPTTIWRVGDYVILEDVFAGVQQGAVGDIKASDKNVQWHWAHVWKVANGKITRAWQWGNFDELYRQIGWPAKKATAKKVAPACSIRS